MHPSEAKVNLALDACRPLLTEEEYRQLFDYNGPHNEWGLAIETLADFLGEKEARITSQQLTLIEAAYSSMRMKLDHRIDALRALMKEEPIQPPQTTTGSGAPGRV